VGSIITDKKYLFHNQKFHQVSPSA
jgi:hypothetical protein